ncbi:hypothetical protein CO661_01590 [Sinorhizobium fredii]|uniref:Phage ABA sandwich domain-containing protein n=1 Tax=Rhizobium fredii TaxID=380 RepID=A0A2A6M6D6_RHIFR|nr:hypothetical protein [Sinorhizobium fredii]PDT50364.1 hypothetical protein CO661_01590 [Sinorhizobium fredii]
MLISDLIEEIEALKRANRDVDVKIALTVGWQRKVELENQREGSRNVVWYWQGEATGKLPPFTASVDAALQLLGAVCGRFVGGISWVGDKDEKLATVSIVGHKYCHASTPALALCATALRIKQSHLNDD